MSQPPNYPPYSQYQQPLGQAPQQQPLGQVPQQQPGQFQQPLGQVPQQQPLGQPPQQQQFPYKPPFQPQPQSQGPSIYPSGYGTPQPPSQGPPYQQPGGVPTPLSSTGGFPATGYQGFSQPAPYSTTPPTHWLDDYQHKLNRTQLRTMFDTADSNHNGTLNIFELKRALEITGDYYQEDTISMMFNLFDKDHSGTISFPEFVRLMGYLRESKGAFDKTLGGGNALNYSGASQALCHGHNYLSQMDPAVLQQLYSKFSGPGNRMDLENFLRMSLLLGHARNKYHLTQPDVYYIDNSSFAQVLHSLM